MPAGIIDFHNHFIGPSFRLKDGAPLALCDPAALIASLEEGALDARVVSAPLEFLAEAGEPDRINEGLAALVAKHPGRLYGLATVDAYAGEGAAKALARAVKDLGLRGVFFESGKAGLLADAKEARPTLAAAAELGVPVFMHPVPDAQLGARFGCLGRLGGRLTRSTINSAGLFALLEGGVFEELPDLHVVVTALAFGGIVLAAGLPDGSRIRRDTPAGMRRHVYMDTTGLDAVALRGAVEILGADHVVLGTDWPVVAARALPARLDALFKQSGLGAEERRLIAGANAARLLEPA